MQRKRAFTLIELLVVIAIIAILAAILFPVFAKARERAKQTKSLNNIKQLALAVTQYSQDYNETFPGWLNTGTDASPAYAHNCWDQQIDSQVKSKDSYNNGDTGIKSTWDPAKARVITYGLNGLLIAPADNTTNNNANFAAITTSTAPAPLSPSSISNPAGTILFAELETGAQMVSPYNSVPAPLPPSGYYTSSGSSQWGSAYTGWIDINPPKFIVISPLTTTTAYQDPPPSTYTSNGIARDLYGGGGCYAFCDGHAKFLKIAATVGYGLTGANNVSITGANCWNSTINTTNNMWIPQ
jgi:prepilin-type N-terminal cleavage/methylation domain-containing protein